MDEIIEYLRALSKDAIVKVSVMDKASMARNSIVTTVACGAARTSAR